MKTLKRISLKDWDVLTEKESAKLYGGTGPVSCTCGSECKCTSATNKAQNQSSNKNTLGFSTSYTPSNGLQGSISYSHKVNSNVTVFGSLSGNTNGNWGINTGFTITF